MKAQWLQTAAAAAAISLSVGAAHAATYDLDYNALYGTVPLTSGTVTIDTALASPVTAITLDGYAGVAVTSSTATGNVIDVVLSYLGGPYFLRYSLASDGTSGAYGLFSGTSFSFPNLLSFGSFSYEEVIASEVPLPAAFPLLAVALGAMGIASRRRKAA